MAGNDPPTTSSDGEGSTSGEQNRNHTEGTPPLETLLLDKRFLVEPDKEKFENIGKLITKLTKANNGEAILSVGKGDGNDYGLTEEEVVKSEQTLNELAKKLEFEHILLRKKYEERSKDQNESKNSNSTSTEGQADPSIVVDYLIRVIYPENDFNEVRVAVVGNVDAGKSTLLGVLTHGELDNGRGLARLKLFRHKHEIESGRTSSVANDILGFDSEGKIVNKPDHSNHLDWQKICEKSSKVITFIDLAGHEKYLKTTIFGMTGHAPDFGMLMVGANAGVIGMAKEHLGLALALSVPVFVVVTKIDMCPPNVLKSTLALLNRVLKSPGCRKMPVLVNNVDDVVMAASNFATERLCPIFKVSNVTGENLELLRMFLNLLMPHPCPEKELEPAQFQIDETYSVPGVGTVVSGLCMKGIIHVNDILSLGPDGLGHFQSVAVKSIHRKRMPVKEVRAGQTASFSLKKLKRDAIRKGMVLVAPSLSPQACWEFEADIIVLHHPTTISIKYQAMVHCGSVRQTASILGMSMECLRTGDKACIHLRFIKNPEYLQLGQKLVFREGRTKAIGIISKLMPGVAPEPKIKVKKMYKGAASSSATAGASQDHPAGTSSTSASGTGRTSEAAAATSSSSGAASSSSASGGKRPGGYSGSGPKGKHQDPVETH